MNFVRDPWTEEDEEEDPLILADYENIKGVSSSGPLIGPINSEMNRTILPCPILDNITNPYHHIIIIRTHIRKLVELRWKLLSRPSYSTPIKYRSLRSIKLQHQIRPEQLHC
ncbi:hypothetical protein Droror1_Dr00010930 [Drosera rotundifolia]